MKKLGCQKQSGAHPSCRLFFLKLKRARSHARQARFFHAMLRHMELSHILKERGERYGTFAENAQVSQRIKLMMEATDKWKELQHDQQESLHMIASKISRILTGDVRIR
jgi:hypothetical protein